MEQPVRRKSPPVLDTLLIPDSPYSAEPTGLATGVASDIFSDPDAWKDSISASSDDSSIGSRFEKSKLRPPELFLLGHDLKTGPPSLTYSSSSADSDSTSWDSVKSGEAQSSHSRVVVAGAKSGVDPSMDPRHASILRYISRAFPPPKIFSPVDVPASAAIPYTPLSVKSNTSFPSPEGNDNRQSVVGGKSASATHFILKYYGVPETPRASRHIPVWDMRSAGPELPPVPSIPTEFVAPSSPCPPYGSEESEVPPPELPDPAAAPDVPAEPEVSTSETTTPEPVEPTTPSVTTDPEEAPTMDIPTLVPIIAPPKPKTVALPQTPPRVTPTQRVETPPSRTPSRTLRRPLPTVPGQSSSRESSPSSAVARKMSNTPPRTLPQAPVPRKFSQA